MTTLHFALLWSRRPFWNLERRNQWCKCAEFTCWKRKLYERRGSVLPRATWVTFGFFIYVWLWWKAVIYHRRYSEDSSYHTCFLCPFLPLNCAAKPHCDVITGKGRYFRALLSFIWILSSSLVLQNRWQHKMLMPTFEIKPCHCWRPTKSGGFWIDLLWFLSWGNK